MEVPPVGVGPLGYASSAPPAGVPPGTGLPPSAAVPASADSIAGLLSTLSESGQDRLLQLLQTSAGAPTGDLVRALGQAIAAQDGDRASQHVRQLAKLDPALAESLMSSPSLGTLKPVIEQLLNQLTAAARLHAESKLGQAIANLPPAALHDEVRPEILLAIATRLFEAGGLTNYSRSAALCDAACDQSRWVPTGAAEATLVNHAPSDRWPSALAWCVLGVIAVALCWWLREDWLPAVSGGWALSALALLIFRRRKLRH
jgi:hypothetical protein